MKKLLVSALAMAMLSLSVSAQEKNNPKASKESIQQGQHKKGMHKQGMHKRREMMKDLNLSDAQQKQLKANRDSYQADLQSIEKEQNITVKEANERKAKLYKQQKEKNEAIFTPEQKSRIADNKLKHEAESKQHSEQKLAKMKMKLALTDDQFAKLQAQQHNNHDKMKAIRDNESLSPETKKHQMKALKMKSMDERKGILTPEQIRKMEESKRGKEARESKR